MSDLTHSKEFRGPEIQPDDITIICRIGVDPESQESKGTQSTVYKALCDGTEVCVKGSLFSSHDGVLSMDRAASARGKERFFSDCKLQTGSADPLRGTTSFSHPMK